MPFPFVRSKETLAKVALDVDSAIAHKQIVVPFLHQLPARATRKPASAERSCPTIQ
jgi:hypothetical protein